MTSRAEITTRYARAFKAADKRTKGPDPGRGRVRDRLVAGQRPASADQRGAEPAAPLSNPNLRRRVA
jgi:hypothetical protein